MVYRFKGDLELKKQLFLIPIVFALTFFVNQNVYGDLFARPDSDPSTRWVNGIGPLPCSDLLTFNCVDEVIRNDADYIQTTGLGNAGSDSQFYTLSNIADPLQSTGHILRYTLREGNEGTNPVGFTITLRQGVTVIATFTHAQGSLPTSFTLFQQTLTAAQANSITNYNNLELTLVGSCITGCGNSPSQRERVAVSWVEFAVITGVSPPTLNAVNVLSPTSLRLVWTQPLDTTSVLSYNIERDNGLGFTVVGNVPVGTVSFDDINLIPDSLYKYRLVSVGSSGNSLPSNEISQTTTVIILPSKFARPDSDPSLRWVNGIGTPPCSDLLTFNCVDELVRDDRDYIQSIGLGDADQDQQFYTMSDVSDPFKSDGHILRYTLREAGEGTNPVGFTITLRQGVSPIATFTHAQGSLPTAFTLFEQELTNAQADLITNYGGLELTLTASCSVGCSNNPSSRDKVQVSWIEFEILSSSPPVIQNVDTLSNTSLRLGWVNEIQNPDDIAEIIIQRNVGPDFITVATLPSFTGSYDDTGLTPQTIYNYRLKAKLSGGGFSNPSDIFAGSTPANPTTLTIQGAIIEPTPTNSFSEGDSQIIAQTIELFNVNSPSMDTIINDINVNRLNAYQIITKMNDGSYDNTQKMKNAGAFYGTIYLNSNNISVFINNVVNTVLSAVNGEEP